MGKYYEGVDDVLRFQEFDSDDEENGVQAGRTGPPVSSGKNINPDELYFNDMDIRAWEQRTAAEQEYDHQTGETLFYDDAGELMSAEDHEEMLFCRVLDKIRIARAAGHADVDLTSEEIDAYQAKLHGIRTPTARPDALPQQSDSSVVNDNASTVSAQTTGKHGKSSSRSKKDPQRTSIFGSKPKKDKEKQSVRKRSSTTVNTLAHASPGFVVPGTDGQSVFTPVNAYEVDLTHDRAVVFQPESPIFTASSRKDPTPPRPPVKEILGAFPGSEEAYQPRPAARKKATRPKQRAYEEDTAPPPRLVPFPVEPYKYHNFSPASTSPTSPPPYIRNVSATPSEASYVSMPRRMPVSAPMPVPSSGPFVVQQTIPVTTAQPPPHTAFSVETYTPGLSTSSEYLQDSPNLLSSGKEGERKKKVKGTRKKA